MGRLMVITTPNTAPGFQLAGVETFVAEDGEQTEVILQQLLAQGEASLIAIRQDLLQDLAPRLRHQLESSFAPLVMAIPGGTPTTPLGERRRYVTELIRRAIGFQITFGAEKPISSN